MKKNYEQKIISFDAAAQEMDMLRSKGKTIVQCHGTFDLIHPGHMIHFQEASFFGDILIVTITGEAHVNKGPGRPFFNDAMRMLSISSMACVDYVVAVPYPAAVEAIECIRPDVYCKGTEYQDASVDVTGNILDDIHTVKRLGGRVEFVGSITFSSTKLINTYFQHAKNGIRSFCDKVLEKTDLSSIKKMVESFSQLKVLVIGDIIFDRYSTVVVQGLTSKDRILSSRYLHDSFQPGGALAVYRHLRQFSNSVKLIGLTGAEKTVLKGLSKYLTSEGDGLVRSEGFTTIVKHRFIESLREGKELSKLFSVNYMDETPPCEKIIESLTQKISEYIDDADIVLALDFGHGLFANPILDLVQKRASFLAVNCQTNSTNYGYNILNKRFYRADMFSLDQKELQLACSKKDLIFEAELLKLHSSMGACYSWLTRGGKETIGIKNHQTPVKCPNLETQVVDAVGAGDAFFSVAALAAGSQLPLEPATLLGQLAGAQAVKIVGNSDSIQKATMLKGLEGLLKR